MIVRIVDALDLIPGWRTLLSNSITTARNKSRQTASENRRANEMLAHQKLETDRAAQAALDASFSASFVPP